MALQIDILYTEDCTDWEIAAQLLQQALDDLGLEAEIQYWLITSDREATEVDFIGSPTIRVNGYDLFPAHSDIPAGLRLRSYITEEGVLGHPTYAMFYEALHAFVE